MSEAIAGMPPAPPPAEPRDAAVVVLVRPGSDGLELFWLRREKTVSFAAGFYAFPGGRVDAADARVPMHGARGEEARLRVAAARELFEETGVILARGHLPAAADLAAARRALLDGARTFADVLSGLGATLAAEDLRPAGRWITPEWMPVRFDARFFLAEAPPGSGAEVWPGELAEGGWIRPAEALARWSAGEALLHPPNLFAIEQAAQAATPEALQAALSGPAAAVESRTRCIEFQRGVRLVALRSPTLLPATHTNCYLLGNGELLVLDPGATEDSEIDRLVTSVEALRPSGLRPRAIVLTHHHLDHVSGVRALRRRLPLPVWCHAQTADRLGFPVDRLLEEGEILALEGNPTMRWRVLHTPGHARGHVCLVDETSRATIAGDMVAGQGTILIDPPEGRMADYLIQLRRLRDLPVRALYPAHGPPLPDGPGALDLYLAHRAAREARVRDALGNEPRTLEEISARAYEDTPAAASFVAERSTLAILLKLAEEGEAADAKGDRLLFRRVRTEGLLEK